MSSDKDLTGIECADTGGGAQGFVHIFKTFPQVGFKMANEPSTENAYFLSLGTMALLLIIIHLGRAGLFSMLVVMFYKHHRQVGSGPAEPKLLGHTKPADIHSESWLVSEKAVLKH